MDTAEDKRKQLQAHYHKIFNSNIRSREEVLDNLAKVCDFYGTTFSDTVEETLYREGRRSVFLHIRDMLGMNE